MILPEYRGKQELQKRGINVPAGAVVETAREARKVAERLDGAVVIKAQVPTGGRGKAGGIVVVSSPNEAEEAARSLIGRSLLGHEIKAVLVEERLEVKREFYLGVIAETAIGLVELIFSTLGGIEIEALAESHPDEVHRLALEPFAQLGDSQALDWLRGKGLDEALTKEVAGTAVALHRTFMELDLILAEINPLALCADGRLVAVDCKMEMDDNALFRHPEFIPLWRELLSEQEREAAYIGVSYVPMDGDVALIASGAGLGMATLDIMKLAGLRPANFLDTGGGITCDLMYRAVRFVLKPAGVRGALINLYGGINPMLEAAHGIVNAVRDFNLNKPLVVKLLGNQQEEAWQLLEEAGITVVKSLYTEEAVRLLAKMLKGANEYSP
ncbi:MAG TPA: ATP-grasp domain-containing protein [Anaerolineae bacterium]|nr:ATP-grasp domain-containing protein [Anaerolineae bacterium]